MAQSGQALDLNPCLFKYKTVARLYVSTYVVKPTLGAQKPWKDGLLTKLHKIGIQIQEWCREVRVKQLHPKPRV